MELDNANNKAQNQYLLNESVIRFRLKFLQSLKLNWNIENSFSKLLRLTNTSKNIYIGFKA